MLIYVKVENLLVPVCQLVPQRLDLSGGWIQLRVQRSYHLQEGEECTVLNTGLKKQQRDATTKMTYKQKEKWHSHHSHCELFPGTSCTFLPWLSCHHPSSSELPSAHPALRLRDERSTRHDVTHIVQCCRQVCIFHSRGCRCNDSKDSQVWVLSGWRSSSSSFFFMISSWASFSWTLRKQMVFLYRHLLEKTKIWFKSLHLCISQTKY